MHYCMTDTTYTTDTASLCLNELERCRNESFGPFFVVNYNI